VSVGAATSLQAEWVGDLAAISPEWDDLADRLHAAPWFRPGWFEAWLQAFGGGTPQIAAVRRDGRLAGLAPMLSRAGVLRSPTNWHTPEFGLLAEDAESRDELARVLFQRRPRRVSLGFLDPDHSGLAESRRAAATSRYRVLVRTLQRSPFVPIRGSFEEYLERLGNKRSKELRRHRRQLEELGAVTFAVEDGRDGLDELLREGFRVEASGWKGTHGTAIQSRPETLRFYTDIARWAAQRGWLRLGFLRLGEEAIAFELMLEAEGILYDVKPGYDEGYRRYSPGHLLNWGIIEYAFSSGARSYEFLGADEPGKLVWASDLRERVLFQAFAPSVPGVLDWAAFAVARPAVKRVLARVRR
jgi:CelD/BcsL family acetyltransferase involved in cellulose biosynthesis